MTQELGTVGEGVVLRKEVVERRGSNGGVEIHNLLF